MTHDEANAAQHHYFAIDDLTRAAHLTERSIGAFAPVDDKSLSLALGHIRGVLAYHKAKAAKIAPPAAPLGDVPL
jgi:hypothetical protein